MTTPLPPALVLTAGLGTRLAPLTNVRAKPAVPVAGIPVVLRQLRWLAAQGVPTAVLNLHHRPNTITRCVGHGTTSGIAVRYSWEPTILGTAGGPRRALPLLDRRFFVVNGDTLTDVDLRALLHAHESSAAQVTLVVTPNPAPERYGGAVVDERGYVTGFARPGPRAHPHFVGVQLVEASVFADLTDGQPTASIGGIYDSLVAHRPNSVKAHETSAVFYDVGTVADYLATSLALTNVAGMASPPPGDRSEIHLTAKLTRTVVWDDVVIEPECRLVDCVVTDGVRLPRHTECERQVITVANGEPPAASRRLGGLWISPFDKHPDAREPDTR